jgi:hypothetical protein
LSAQWQFITVHIKVHTVDDNYVIVEAVPGSRRRRVHTSSAWIRDTPISKGSAEIARSSLERPKRRSDLSINRWALALEEARRQQETKQRKEAILRREQAAAKKRREKESSIKNRWALAMKESYLQYEVKQRKEAKKKHEQDSEQQRRKGASRITMNSRAITMEEAHHQQQEIDSIIVIKKEKSKASDEEQGAAKRMSYRRVDPYAYGESDGPYRRGTAWHPKKVRQ